MKTNFVLALLLVGASYWPIGRSRLDDRVYTLSLSLEVSPANPTVWLKAFYDKWQEAAGRVSLPPVFWVGETNRTVERSFSGKQVPVKDCLDYLASIMQCEYTVYTNGIVFFPKPTGGQLISRDLPISKKAAQALGIYDAADTQSEVGSSLRPFGVRFPSLGALAIYDQARGVLTVRHVSPELDKIEFVLQMLDRGASSGDEKSDATIHFCELYYEYAGHSWVEHRTAQQPAPAAPAPPAR